MNHSAPAGDMAMALMIGLMLFVAVVLYFLPTFVAGMRGHQNTVPIFVLNLFLGWTGAGWIIGLVWALTQVHYTLSEREGRCSRSRCGGAKAVVGALTVAAFCTAVVGVGIAGMCTARSSHAGHGPATIPAPGRVADPRANLPAETKIQALKQEVSNLSPAINTYRATVARETAEVSNWTKEVTAKKAQLEEDREYLREMRQAIKDGKDFKTKDGDRIPNNILEQQFARKFEEYKAVDQAALAAEETLTIHRERRDTAQEKVLSLEIKQKELKARVEKLEGELVKLRDAELKGKNGVDDHGIADVNDRIDEIETRIAEQKKLQELQKDGDIIERTLKDRARSRDALKEWDEANPKK